MKLRRINRIVVFGLVVVASVRRETQQSKHHEWAFMMYVQNVFRGAYNCLCEVTLQALARADSVFPWWTGLCERAAGDIIFTRQNATYDRLELSYLVGEG